MTKKKRKRKEQRHQRGKPPPPSTTAPVGTHNSSTTTSRPTNDLDKLDAFADFDGLDDLGDPFAMDGLEPFFSPEELGPDYSGRPTERTSMRMQRYVERQGITTSPENEFDVLDLLELHRQTWEGEAYDPPSMPLARAQALIHDAFELPMTDSQERVDLAEQALQISNDCADAHVLLAESEIDDDKAACRRFEDAVAAGERAFRDVDVTARPRDYWFLMKLRPLIRALVGAATRNRLLGNHERALEHYRRLYTIDQLDVMDVRDGYVGHLMEMGLDAELIEFLPQQHRLDRLEADTLHVRWSHALARFRVEGDSQQAKSALQTAEICDPRISRFLTGAEMVEIDVLLLPGFPNDLVEASEYYASDAHLWLRTPNAIEWLRANSRAGQSDNVTPIHPPS